MDFRQLYNNANYSGFTVNLQEKLIELSAYNVGCSMSNGFALINITYEKGWNVVPPQNSLIECAMEDGIYYYCAPIDRVNLEEVFDSIQETINYNQEVKEKLELFQKKIEQLRELFAEESLDVLKTIEFKVKKKKEVQEVKPIVKRGRPKKSATPKKEAEQLSIDDELGTDIATLYNENCVDNEEDTEK